MEALIWLRKNNQLSKEVEITHTLIDDWEDEFIFSNVKSYLLQYDLDLDERDEYTANLNPNNYKNKLYHKMNNVGLNNSGLLSGCSYTNAHNA